MNMLNFKCNKKIIQKNVYANTKRSCSDSKSETQDLRQRDEIITNFQRGIEHKSTHVELHFN